MNPLTKCEVSTSPSTSTIPARTLNVEWAWFCGSGLTFALHEICEVRNRERNRSILFVVLEHEYNYSDGCGLYKGECL